MRLIPATIKLAFDPETTTDPELQEVIADDIAWAIWLLWRPCHIVSQHFNQSCINIAKRVRQAEPQNMREWVECFGGIDFPHKNVDDWISQAYPFLTGMEKIRIEVAA